MKRLAAAHSRVSYGPLILHVRSLSSAISLFSAQAWFEAGQSSNSKATSCSVQARSVTTALVGKIIGHFEAVLTEDSSQRKLIHCFPVQFWSSVLEARPLGMAFQFRRKVIDQEDRDGVKAVSDFSSSPWFSRLSLSPDSQILLASS